ncbi:MAG: hypothetical protein ACP5OB_00595 [Candidatus Ratteibacteria bacterium]
MKKIMIILGLLVFVSYGDIKKASLDEVKNSIKFIEETIKNEKEDFVPLFAEAIEIEKRATTPIYAERIKEKICKTAKIKENDFENMRMNFSFFDISIAWAINQIKGIPLEKILKEKEDKNWIEVLSKIDIDKEKLKEKIKELNPKLKTF